MREGVVFLMYHELETPGRVLRQAEPGYVRYIVRASDFRAQMELLRNEGWKGLSVGDAVASFADKTVAITFDDGCETDLLSAAPILREFDFGATFYITSGWSGQPGYLAHSQIRELSSLGFEIGCHSMSHLYLTDLDDAGLRREIVDAKLFLEKVISRPVEHFSCPGGRFDRRVANVARDAGYRTVATSETEANTPATDSFAWDVWRSCAPHPYLNFVTCAGDAGFGGGNRRPRSRRGPERARQFGLRSPARVSSSRTFFEMKSVRVRPRRTAYAGCYNCLMIRPA